MFKKIVFIMFIICNLGFTNNFKVIEKHKSKEIDSTIYLLEHTKTKTLVTYFENDDEEKLFNIGFKTLPNDDTGVNHIIEHCVLNGSKKYPLKSPFVNLIASSPNTFLNALTYPDFTCYPLASYYEKDFNNLMNIYLDAVFFPKLLENENIFLQEGIRVEFDENNKPFYNGTVYNEMKSVFSDPLSILLSKINKSIIPNSNYSFYSGGIPKSIETLTYEQVLKTYKAYYNPTNATIVLYGKQDINNSLKIIDSYLSKLEYVEPKPYIKSYAPISKNNIIYENYDVDFIDSNNKNYLSVNYVLNQTSNYKETLILENIINILTLNEYSPLTKALKSFDDNQIPYYYFNKHADQTILSIIVENFKEENTSKILDAINLTFDNIKNNGVEDYLLESAKNKYKYILAEKNQSLDLRGLDLSTKCIYNFTHKNTPFYFIDESSIIKNLDNNTIKKYIDKYFINNITNNTVVLTPKLKELDKYQINKLNKLKYNNFKIWQDQKDSPTAIKTLPKFNISDLKANKSVETLNKYVYNNVTYLKPVSNFGDISKFYISFGGQNIPYDKLHYHKLYTDLLNSFKFNLDTLDYTTIKNLAYLNFGQIDFTMPVYANFNNPNDYEITFDINFGVNNDNIDTSVHLIEKFLSEPSFDKKILLSFLIEKRQLLKDTIPTNISQYLSVATINSSKNMEYYLNSYPYYVFLNNLLSNFDDNYDNIVSELKNANKSLIHKNDLIISYNSPNKIDLFSSLTKSDFVKPVYKLDAIPNKTAFIDNNAKTQTIYVAFKLNSDLKNNYGNFSTIVNLINYKYLWPEVRDVGGAYSVSSNLLNDGTYVATSGRDPNLSKTLKRFDSVSSYIKDNKFNTAELNQSIIKTVAKFDKAPNYFFEKSIMLSRNSFSPDQFMLYRNQALNTKLDDFKKFANSLEKIDAYSVTGNEDIINKNINLFDEIIRFEN